MKRKIRWTSLALKDLIEIKEYIQGDNPAAARQEAQKIKKSTERLSRFPKSGRPLEKIPLVWEVVAGNYHVYYRHHAGLIEILRVYHGKRRPLIS